MALGISWHDLVAREAARCLVIIGSMTPNSPELRSRSPWGLGIVFVVMAFLALLVAWAGYSLRWVRQRNEVIGWGNRLNFSDIQPYVIVHPRVILGEQDGAARSRDKTKSTSAPGLLWLFGERVWRHSP